MNKVNHEAVKRLLELEDGTALSLYLPTHRLPTPMHIEEDKIRLKNLIRRGEEALEASGVDEEAIRKITNELEAMVEGNTEFWQHTTEGLVVFAAPAGVHYFHLPVECEELVSAGDSFDIAPLLAVMSYDCPYYLLALATHNPVVFRGSVYGVEKLPIELPKSPESALNIDELFSNSQTARGGDQGSGNPGAKSHGQGDSRQAGQEERLKYFRIIDEEVLSSKAIDQNIPFLLAGTEDEVSSYREISKIRHLLEVSVSGNHTETPPHDIHAQAWLLVSEEVWQAFISEEIEKFSNLLGTGRSSIDAEAVMAASGEGRVDTLLIKALTVTRDSVSDSDEAVMKLVFPDSYEEGKLSALVRSVFDQGGKIVAVPHDRMPENADIAAVYRY